MLRTAVSVGRGSIVRRSVVAKRPIVVPSRGVRSYVSAHPSIPRTQVYDEKTILAGPISEETLIAAEKAGVRFWPDEENRVKANGLSYAHAPFAAVNWSLADAQKAVDQVSKLPKPILVHCAGTKRAAVVALAHQAQLNHWDSQRIFKEMHDKQIDLSPSLQQLLEQLVQK